MSFNTIATRTSSSSGQWAPAVQRPEHEADRPHAFRVCIVLFVCTRSVRCIYRPNAALTNTLPTYNICSLDVTPCVPALLGKGGQLRLKALRSFQTPTQRFTLQQQANLYHSDGRKSRTSDILIATFCMPRHRHRHSHRHPLQAFYRLQRSVPQLLATALLYSEMGLWIHLRY